MIMDSDPPEDRLRRFFEGNGVHAVAQAARGWAIGEHMAQVSVACVADGFDPLQEAWTIEAICDDVGG